ncbi:hypothetical protein Ctob_011263 [Chrysochromulina tobinii]|uniref:Uncharacterized protein n=1 Tax=Chrysochromulina tobinii TaxID=1460289 RepID=A0A0M0JQG2_9EUKA|nr:hypothetical protein Ctob_011263 [Chrysochromulina tobinii]|eukprot:KOO28532.1 hypothetical protein Ctob_011263 [Chrysochromulina sp. CCMP291]
MAPLRVVARTDGARVVGSWFQASIELQYEGSATEPVLHVRSRLPAELPPSFYGSLVRSEYTLIVSLCTKAPPRPGLLASMLFSSTAATSARTAAASMPIVTSEVVLNDES